jgi:hypothetical protein
LKVCILLGIPYSMPTIILTRNETFKFTDTDSSSYYVVNIMVQELEYSIGQRYYDISYDFIFIAVPDSHDNSRAHPFFGSQVDDFMKYNGDIIVKNRLSSIMVDYLLMDNEQLSLESGHTTPQRYRQNIMWSIAHYFWD